jgi:hypothetical protein
MTLEKWTGLLMKEQRKLETDLPIFFDPSNWKEASEALKIYIKNVDEMTEVYNMENKGN